MSISISKSDLKPKLLSYLRKVEQKKESIIVMDRGTPVAKIIPYTEKKKNILDQLAHSVIHYDNPLDPVGEEDWELK